MEINLNSVLLSGRHIVVAREHVYEGQLLVGNEYVYTTYSSCTDISPSIRKQRVRVDDLLFICRAHTFDVCERRFTSNVCARHISRP